MNRGEPAATPSTLPCMTGRLGAPRVNNQIQLCPSSRSIGPGKAALDFVRKYDVDVGNRTMFWMGMVPL